MVHTEDVNKTNQAAVREMPNIPKKHCLESTFPPVLQVGLEELSFTAMMLGHYGNIIGF